MGMDLLNKANDFYRDNNWPQAFHHSDLAATKLMRLKDRPIDDISSALDIKCTALGFLGRFREQLECAKEWYCLWNRKPTDMGAIDAIFALINSCLKNNEYEDAKLYASTVLGIINHQYDNKIPEDQRQPYLARGAYYLAEAILRLAQSGSIPPAQQPNAGREAIAHVRRALEIHTQLYGTENNDVANDMLILAEALGYIKSDDDEEVFRLLRQAKAIHTRVYGSSTANVAVAENKLGNAYCGRANRAHAANDFNRAQANLELALPHLREAARIYRFVGHIDNADKNARVVVDIEEKLQELTVARAAAAAAEAIAATKG